jgi:tape measure domain-containing protein
VASYPAVIELRVDGITQVTRVLDSIDKLDRALVSIKKTPLAIDSKNATDGIRVLKDEVDKFIIKLGKGETQLAATTAGVNAQAAAFKNLAANAKIGGQAFKLYTQATEQARQKSTLAGGLAEIAALRSGYQAGRTAPMQSFMGTQELIKFAAQIPKNTASLELYKAELQRVLTVVDYGTKDYRELEAAIAGVNKQIQIGQGLGPVQGPVRPGVGVSGGARGRQAGGSSRFAGAISNAVIGGSFPLLFGQSGGAAVGGAVGGIAGSLLGPGGGFAGSLLGTLLGETASKGEKIKELANDIGFTVEQTKRLQEAFALAGRDSEKFTASVQNIRGLNLSLEDQADAINLVANLTEIYKGRIDKVASAFATAVANGKVTQTTLNQLTKEGITIQDALAKKYGVSQSKILQMAKDGTISVQDLIDTLVELGNVAQTEATKTEKSWATAWEDLQRGAGLSLQATVAVFNAITGAGIQSSGNIAADFAAMYVTLVKGAINMAERVSRILANLSRGGANLAATFSLGGINPFPKAALAGFKQAEQFFSKLDANLQGINLEEPQRTRVGAITANGQLPSQGSDARSGRSKVDRAAEEKQRLDALLKQLNEEIRIRTESIGLEESLLNARADQNDELEAQIQSSMRLLEIGSKQAVVQKNFDAGRIGRAEYTLRLQLLELDRTEDQIKYEEDLNRIFKERYGITDALARLSRETRAAAFGGTGATGTFRTDINLMPGLTGGLLGEEYDEVKTQLDELLKIENQVASAADTIGQAFGNSFKGILNGTLSAQEALAGFFSSVADSFADMVSQMIAQWIRMQIIGLAQSLLPGGSTVFPQGVGNFSGAFGSASSVSFNPGVAFGGFRAAGGSVTGGTSYMVGERGPELFVPGRSGTIVANDKMGGGNTNVVVNVDASGSKVEGDEQEGKQLGRVIAAAIQQELVKQKRPGGLLA